MTWIPVLVVHAVFAVPIAGQIMTMDTLSLYRLPGVYVEVGLVSEEAAQDGFHRDSVRAVMIQKLNDARIRVLTEEEWQVTLRSPTLHVRINLLRASPYLYLYSVELELRQLVVMMGDSQPVFAPTWRSGQSLGSVRASAINSITSLILAGTDRFISAHAVANRRRRRFE